MNDTNWYKSFRRASSQSHFKDFAVLEFKSNVNFLISTRLYLIEHVWSQRIEAIVIFCFDIFQCKFIVNKKTGPYFSMQIGR